MPSTSDGRSREIPVVHHPVRLQCEIPEACGNEINDPNPGPSRKRSVPATSTSHGSLPVITVDSDDDDDDDLISFIKSKEASKEEEEDDALPSTSTVRFTLLQKV
jgi:hypothetical protein